MEDKHNAAQDNQSCGRKTCRVRGMMPFLLGLAVALVFGWWLFPELLYSEQEQPVKFTHKSHVTDAGLDCS